MELDLQPILYIGICVIVLAALYLVDKRGKEIADSIPQGFAREMLKDTLKTVTDAMIAQLEARAAATPSPADDAAVAETKAKVNAIYERLFPDAPPTTPPSPAEIAAPPVGFPNG